MKELNQKIFLEERRFKLTDVGLELYCNDRDAQTNSFWSYDEFSNEVRTYTEKFPKIFYIGLGLLLASYLRTAIMVDSIERATLSSTLLFALGWALIGFYYFYQKKYKLLYLDNDQQVFVLAGKPNEKQVDAFIETFFEMRKKDYRKRYFKINFENDQQKEIDRMNWLRREDIISQIELDFMIEEIQIKFL